MLEHYQARFAKLRTDKSAAHWPAKTCHCAPYKPFVLLAVMDLLAQGILQSNFIAFNADLMDVFDLYWNKIMGEEKRSNPVMPFFHLKSDGFWHLQPVPGKEGVLAHTRQIRSIGHLRELVVGVAVDEGLFALLQEDEARAALRRTLIETYFAPEVRSTLVELGQVSAEAFEYSRKLLDRSRGRFKLDLKDAGDAYHEASRSTAFRRIVMDAYNYTCTMSQLHVLTPEGRSAVVAAHIVPWSESHNDDPRNGLALSPLCHWAFDQGLIGVTSEYTVMVSPAIPQSETGAEPLLELAERALQLPVEKALWPANRALNWHWKNVYRAEAPPQSPRLF